MPSLGVICSKIEYPRLQQESHDSPCSPVPTRSTDGCGRFWALQPGGHACDRLQHAAPVCIFLLILEWQHKSALKKKKKKEGPAFPAGKGSSAPLRGSRSQEQAGRTGEGDAFSTKRLSSCPKPAQRTVPGTSPQLPQQLGIWFPQ